MGNLTWYLPTTWHWISAKADKNLIHNLSRFLYHTKYTMKEENVICQPRSVSIGKKCALMGLSMAWGSFPLYTDWPILSFNNLVSSTNYNFIKCEFVSYITWLKTATANFSITVKSEASSQRKGTVLELASSSAPAKVHSAIKMISLLNIFLYLTIILHG